MLTAIGGHACIYTSVYVCTVFVKCEGSISREQTFGFVGLVLVGIGPGTNKRISPGWNYQSELESPAQWIVQQAFAARTFSPGLWFKLRLKVAFQSRLEPPTRTKGPAGLLSWVLAPTGTIG